MSFNVSSGKSREWATAVWITINKYLLGTGAVFITRFLIRNILFVPLFYILLIEIGAINEILIQNCNEKKKLVTIFELWINTGSRSKNTAKYNSVRRLFCTLIREPITNEIIRQIRSQHPLLHSTWLHTQNVTTIGMVW